LCWQLQPLINFFIDRERSELNKHKQILKLQQAQRAGSAAAAALSEKRSEAPEPSSVGSWVSLPAAGLASSPQGGAGDGSLTLKSSSRG